MKKVFTGLLLLAIVFFVTGCGGEKSALPVKSPATSQNLGLTVEQFTAAFNELAASRNRKELQITNLEFLKGDVKDAGKSQIKPNLHFLCSIDKSTGNLLEVALISEPKNLSESLSLIESYEIIIDILNPDLTPEQREFMLNKFEFVHGRIKHLEENLIGKPKMMIQGNVRYDARKNDSQPILLTASAIGL